MPHTHTHKLCLFIYCAVFYYFVSILFAVVVRELLFFIRSRFRFGSGWFFSPISFTKSFRFFYYIFGICLLKLHHSSKVYVIIIVKVWGLAPALVHLLLLKVHTHKHTQY